MRNIHSLNIAKFPDGHKHLILLKEDLGYDDLEEIGISIKSFDDLFLLAQAKKICKNLKKLKINYLLAARCDRQFSDGEAVDLEIVADFINALNFEEVEILKPHSKISLALIKNSKEISVTKDLLQMCIVHNKLTNYSVIAPDKGAGVWIEEEVGNTNIVKCNKIRVKGQVDKIEIPEDAEIKEDCIIVDDLCDGGATFIECSKELKIRGAKNVYLCVTHGIFSREFSELEKHLTKIYFTNSFLDKDDIFLNFGKISFDRECKFVNDRLIQLDVWKN